MHLLPWWALLACLAPAAFAAYLLLGRTQAGGSPWALFALTAVAAPLVLAGATAAAVVLSTMLSAALEDRAAPPTEGTELEATSGRASPATGGPSASPGASPAASSSAPASP